jgi:hypothetical protein
MSLPPHANADAIVQLILGMEAWEGSWNWHDSDAESA